jgi:hypothetical protein
MEDVAAEYRRQDTDFSYPPQQKVQKTGLGAFERVPDWKMQFKLRKLSGFRACGGWLYA